MDSRRKGRELTNSSKPLPTRLEVFFKKIQHKALLDQIPRTKIEDHSAVEE